MFFTRVAPHTKSKGLPIGGPLLSKKLVLFTRVAPRTKSNGLLIGDPLLSKKTYAFYTCSTAYKKQGAPDRRSLTQQKKLMLFTRVAPRTKSKRLPIDGPLLSEKLMFFTRLAPCTKSKGLLIGTPHIFYYFQHAFHRVQKARDSIVMCSRFIILLIKFLEVFAAQLVSSSLCIIQTISHQIPIVGSIYLSYTTVINIQE
jgi:hypothetical protein